MVLGSSRIETIREWSDAAIRNKKHLLVAKLTFSTGEEYRNRGKAVTKSPARLLSIHGRNTYTHANIYQVDDEDSSHSSLPLLPLDSPITSNTRPRSPYFDSLGISPGSSQQLANSRATRYRNCVD